MHKRSVLFGIIGSALTIQSTDKEDRLPEVSQNRIRYNAHALPKLRFEEQQLTSFAGLIVVQSLFARLNLPERLRQCLRPPRCLAHFQLRAQDPVPRRHYPRALRAARLNGAHPCTPCWPGQPAAVPIGRRADWSSLGWRSQAGPKSEPLGAAPGGRVLAAQAP